MLRYKVTFRCYSEWLERDSSDWDTRLALARVAALAGRTMKAVDIYEQLAGEDSLDFFVNYQLARLYQQIGKTVRTIGIYDRLYQTDTTNVILLKRIGDCYNRIGWSMNAVDHYLRAVCLDPEDGETVVKAVNLMMANTVLFQAYKKLTGKQQQEVMAAIRDTNRVADLCENNSGLKAVCLKKFPAAFQQPLKNLFVHLWENALRSPKFNDHFSTGLEDFIDKFIAENKSIEVCPFCALESFYDLQGQSRREIGHWLCKEQYPYLVVNFDNLVPIGHACTLVKHRCVYYPEYRLHLTFKRTGTNK